MRYLKTLLVSLLALVGTSAFAQTWTGSEAAAGTYYLYNVGTGKWLCGGNNWGTHASVADYGIDFILAGSNGAYTLDSQLSNGGNSHFLNGEWCDGASMNWTFTQVKTEDGAIAYTIGNGQQFLTANTSDTNVNLKGNEGALSQWILVSKADIAQAALDAKATDVVDVTGFIIGQRTSRNNTRAQVTGDRQLNSNNNVWKMERDADGRWCNFAMNGAGGTGSTAKPYAIEAWNWKSFNFYQDITGVPNGKYTLHVNSFYRGYDGIRGYVYANDAMSPLTAETDAYKSYGVGNDLQNAAAAFFDGKYDNSVDVTVTNGSIRVGVKQMDAPGGDWMPFANFRLEYKGMASLLKNSIDKANELIPTLDEQNAAGLQEAVDAAQAVYDNPDATNAEIQEAIEALEEAYKNFNAVNEAKQLAYDVLTQVPAALYPEDFDWAAERNYKYYKNNEGKYKLASREAVAALIEILDMVENPTEGSEIPADEAAKLLNGLARYIVETHSVGAALGEQGDKGYVDHAYMAEDYEFYHWLLDLFGYPGFDPNYTGHITNPDLADGEEGWENDGFRTLSDQPLSDAEATIFGEEASYTYFDQWSKDGFKADAHQTFQLPAGRYMLTVAGRGSANKAFTEIGAQDPDNYFQLYAKTFQGETKMVSIEQIGDKDGVFGNGWNDYSVFFTMPSIGEVTVGIRAASSGEGWVSATRFRLTRLGDPTVYLNENESFEGDLNFDALTWLFDGDEGTAPVDMLLHKKMQAGKWYSIAVPGDLPYDQIIREFGEGTLLAQPIGALDLDAEGKQKALTFYEWDPMESYGLGSDNMYGSPVDGMIANVPYLIKPAKVKASNRYLFKNIIATEKKSVENSEWSWGAISCSSDPDYVGYYWTSDDADVKFYPNYTYKPMFANGYTVEMCDTVKAFTGVFETEGAEIGTIVLLSVDEEGNLDFGDDAFDIPVQQILDLIALGQQKAGWYPGIPAAMTKKLTTVPELGTSVADYVDAINALKSAIQEAQKAYEPSKKFNALMKQAEELLASDHTELVAGADAAFKKKIEQLQKRFDMQLKAEPINGLIEQLEEAIAEYKDQIYTGILETGKYILKNVATGKFFNGANSWGTRSSLVDHPEYMLLTKLDDGTYTLESRQNNGGEQFYFGPNYFVDNGTPMPLTFTVVGKGIYTITCNGESGVGLLGYDGSTSVLSGTLTDATSEDAQWLVCSEKDMAAMMAEASLENPVDVSFFIKDANFSRNHRDVAAWIWETENHNIAGANENFCAESWTHTFVLSQEVELPNGVYMLNAQAALTDYTNAYDKRDDYPVVFAGDETVKFCEMEEADRATSMTQLSGSFSAGKYFVDPVIVKVTDGKLTIGAKCDATDYWCIFDNFSLTYFADADIDAVRAAYPKNTGATTGINEVNTGVNTGAIYNLNGVRVNNMTKKGVYIVNGKKFVVK